MLTKFALKLISFSFAKSTFLRLLPFTWSTKQFKLSPIKLSTSQSKTQFLIYLLPGFYIWVYTAFLILQYFLNKSSLQSKHNLVRGVLHFNYSMVYTFVSIIIWNTWKHRTTLAIFVNQYFGYIKSLDENILPEHRARKKRKFDICELCLGFILVCTYGHSFIGAIFFLEDPTSPRYWYSLIGESFPSIWILLLFCGIEFMTYVIIWHQLSLIGIIFLCYFNGTIQWLQEIQKGGLYTGKVMCNPKYSLPVYRTFQVLGQSFKCCFSGLLLPIVNFFWLIIPITTNNLTIRFHDQMSFIFFGATVLIAFASALALLILYPKAAAVNTLSLAYLKSLSSPSAVLGNGLGPGYKKQVKAFFPLKIKFGSFGFIQRFTTLKMIVLIFYWTLKTLLLTRKK